MPAMSPVTRYARAIRWLLFLHRPNGRWRLPRTHEAPAENARDRPEEDYGDGPEKPEPFNLDEVNRRLAGDEH
jgi:hypothetical protein